MPKISEAWIEKEIRKLLVQEEYSPRQVYEELKRRAEENNWDIEGTTGLSAKERNRKIKGMVKEHLSTLEKIRYYLVPPPFTLPGEGLGSVAGGAGSPTTSSGGTEGPPESQSPDVPDYRDEAWDMLKDEVADILRDIHGFGPKRIEYLKEEITRVQYGVKDRVDLREMASKGASQRELADNIVPVLEDWEVPYVSPYSTADKVEGAAGQVGGSVERGLAYLTGGYFRIYIERTIALLLFFVSGAMVFSTLIGGIREFATVSGVIWTLVFVVSAYWWGAVLDFRFPGKGWLKGSGKWWEGASISDEVLMVMFVLSVGLWALAFTGSVELLALIPLVGLVLGSATPGTIFLITGIVGLLILYHAEDMPRQVARYASGAREAGRRVNEAPRRSSSSSTGEAAESGGDASGDAGAEAIGDMIESARDRLINMHSAGRISDDEFEAVETDITEAEMHLDRGRKKDAERKVNVALEQINEMEGA